MENLHIKTEYSLTKRIVLGGGIIIVSVIILILGITLEISLIAGLIPLIGFGVLFFTRRIGSYKTQINIGKGFLEIIWPDRGKINVLESEIDAITLSTKYIMISRKARKDVQLVLYDKDQETQVSKFLLNMQKKKILT